MSDTKRCPYCGEEIKAVAIKCKHCGSMLVEGPTPGTVDAGTYVKVALSSKYEIIEEIGRGGMSVVYKALQKNLDRTVALKVLPPQLAQDKEYVDRFHREARAVARLQHPNIMTIYDEGVENGIHYMSMELLEGVDLQQRIKKSGPVSVQEIVTVIVPIANALDYAHNNGLVHRDIKCGNIYLNKDGRVILTDFGIAHAIKGTQLTVSGTVLGTPEFMSPEQAEGKDIDGRSDIYSLGIVMYYSLTGRFPFSGDNPITTIYKILHERYTPISQLTPVPDWLGSVIDGCLERDPARRIQFAREVSRLLAHKESVDRRPFPKTNAQSTIKLDPQKEQDWLKPPSAPRRESPVAAPKRESVPPPPTRGPVSSQKLQRNGRPIAAQGERGDARSYIPLIVGLVVLSIVIFMMANRSQTGSSGMQEESPPQQPYTSQGSSSQNYGQSGNVQQQSPEETEAERNRQRVSELLAAARRSEENGEWNRAGSYYDQVLQISPDNETALQAKSTLKERWIASLLSEADNDISSKKFSDAYSNYMEVTRISPSNTRLQDRLQYLFDLVVSSADNLYNSENYNQAEAYYQLALKIKPGDMATMIKLTKTQEKLQGQ